MAIERVGWDKRAGTFVRQPQGFRAFIPAELPPNPSIQLGDLTELLSEADRAIGRLDGVSATLPNPDLFVAMYVRKESVLSSQIEGTQSSMDDVLAFELDASARRLPNDVEEVVNHVAAMNYGLRRLAELPLSLRLIREIHGQLMKGVRGQEKAPGEFRRTQNWIGGTTPSNARFVPPPAHELSRLLGNFEHFLHEPDGLPPLVHAGVVHAQFETIHPFLDGNGRVGRLLITFLLVHAGVLSRPLLYLSHYLKRYRPEYYDLLTAVRESGDWEGWLRFFLRGVAETATEATETAGAILLLREEHEFGTRDMPVNASRLLDHLYQQPLVTASAVKDALHVSWPTANKLLTEFTERGILDEVTGQRRNRTYRYSPYLDLLLGEGDEPVPA
jgi:Fic family protein